MREGAVDSLGSLAEGRLFISEAYGLCSMPSITGTSADDDRADVSPCLELFNTGSASKVQCRVHESAIGTGE